MKLEELRKIIKNELSKLSEDSSIAIDSSTAKGPVKLSKVINTTNNGTWDSNEYTITVDFCVESKENIQSIVKELENVLSKMNTKNDKINTTSMTMKLLKRTR